MIDATSLHPQITPNRPRLMLFDLALGGHHGNYIQHLIDYAYEKKFLGEIDIVVLPQFADVHRDTVKAIAASKHPPINLVSISIAEEAALGSRNSGVKRTLRNFREWDIFCKYAQKLQTTYALIMYLDTYALPIAFGKKSPCSFSGIYFRPTFHYSTFASYQLSGQLFGQPAWKKNIQHWREKITVDQILRRSQLHKLLCLDPFAVKALQSSKMIHLADPVSSSPPLLSDLSGFQAELGIEQHRRVFLLFGALDERKGIYQLLDAIELLHPEIAQNFCLLIVGKTNPDEQTRIQPKIAVLSQTHPVQILELYDFIPEDKVLKYFQAADVILAPYQRHVGMSGILLLAAAAGKPVLSSSYGLMGELVEHHQLGLAVDSTVPAEIAQALSHYVLEPPTTFGDRHRMSLFAEQNSIELYSSTIFQCITGFDQQVSSNTTVEVEHVR
jgi:glycosyltransferase involved in cell wall biosynthesis